MSDFERQFRTRAYDSARTNLATASIFKFVYGWMSVGLIITAVTAFLTAATGLCGGLLAGPAMYIFIGIELLLVFSLSAAIGKIHPLLAALMFLLYSVVNGITLSTIFFVYDIGSIGRVFFISAGMFGGLAVWGTITKNDLTSIGSICGMAVWGLIVALLVNLFLRSSGLDFFISFIGILVFSGLTMYDAAKIKQMAASEYALDAATKQRLAIIGALQLYLDFINLFLYILRFLGRRR